MERGWDARQIRRHLRHLKQDEQDEVVRLVGGLQVLETREFHGAAWLREQKPFLSLAGLRIHGVADAYDPRIGIVIDYKTDTEISPADHLLQLSIYAWALGMKAAAIIYVRHGHVHRFGPEDLNSGMRHAEALISELCTGDFSPRPGKACHHCSFRGICDASAFNS